ncbi:uncharacterized protein LOC111388744 [Olea europaea var. sylvestris]|uniref:uncharacterized protein LOC111388744 n=1 Tax=Olea europaea var. sylvestris TaxID=158386 RepID=UPI000C1D4910|nr:uncharacterized protein LOC111388744 [Olea europaea var. sylvestris]
MDPIIKYLAKDKVSKDPLEARRLKALVASFTIIDGQFYKQGFTMPYPKCICPTEVEEILFEVHTGTCGNHHGATSLAFKILRQGYYWPTMKEDAKELVRKCDTCQRHGNLIHVPAEQQTTIFGAESLVTITTGKIQGFVWKNIMCRFEIPRVLVTNNDMQFDNHSFKTFCASYHIDHKLTSVAHPQSNGQAEVINRVILLNLKTRLEKEKGLWADELPNVLWAYHTTPRETIRETPFRLTFRMEAVVPVKILSETGRMNVKQPNDTATKGELDLLEEVREKVAIKMMAYKQRAAGYFNRRVKPRIFQPGDLVLRDAAAVGHPLAKLGPNCEGPYEVICSLGNGAYSLKDIRGRPLDRP